MRQMMRSRQVQPSYSAYANIDPANVSESISQARGMISIYAAVFRSCLQLINHPDKNPHRIEEATKIFADLQQAYEVRESQTGLLYWLTLQILSDPDVSTP